jgi:hypothetical protein
MQKFITEIATWYWWLSVVLVGLVINLVSAYLKPWIDGWWSNRSERARARRKVETEEFQRKTSHLASDPMLLVIAGQRHHDAEMATISASVFFVFLLVFSSYIGSAGSVPVLFRSIAQWATAILLTGNVMILLLFMRKEAALGDVVRKARSLFESKHDHL